MPDTATGTEQAAHPTAQPGAEGHAPTATPATVPTDANLSREEKELATNQKRIEDKKAYLDKLIAESNAQRSDLDRQIAEAQTALKRDAERIEQQMRAPAPAPDAPPAPPAPAASQAASVDRVAGLLNISGDQAFELLEKAPDQFFRVLEQGIEQSVERRVGTALQQYEQRQRAIAFQEGTRARFTQAAGRIESEGRNPVELMAVLERHRAAGFSPTPEQIELEVRFGPMEAQRRYMEIGKALLDAQENQADPNTATAQAPGQPGAGRAHPGLAFPRGNGLPPLATAAPDPNVRTVNIGPSFANRLAQVAQGERARRDGGQGSP